MTADTARLEGAFTGAWVAALEWQRHPPKLRLQPEAGWPEPLLAESEPCTVVFDGTLYEEDRLRRYSGVSAVAIDTAEFILSAYLRLGPDLFGKLRGRFSLVIWDSRGSTLLCVRDPIGIHPLFYARSDREIVVSPSLDALRLHRGVSRTVDPVVAAGYIVDLMPALGQTMFSAVRRVPAGHVLQVDEKRETLDRYWTPDRDTEARGSKDELVGEFRALISQAVRRCLDVGPVGVFLSGGLDSASVAATAAELRREKSLPSPVALSLTFPGLEANEEATQRRVATALGLPGIIASTDDLVGPGRLLHAALALGGSTTSPTDLLQPAYDALMLQAKEHGCRAILTGDGGDEWLFPRPEYAANRLLALDAPALYRFWRAWCAYWPLSVGVSTRALLWHWGMRPLLRATAARALVRWSPGSFQRGRRARLAPWIPPWVAPEPALRDALLDWAIANADEPRPADLYEQAKRKLLDDPRVSMLLEERFSTRRRLGLHVLTPLLDADLVGFLYRAPERLLLDGGRAKALARELLAPHLPFADQWPRTVYGEDIWQSAMRAEGREASRALGGLSVLSELGVVDGEAFAELLESGASRLEATHAAFAWVALRLESWLRPRISGTLP